MFTGIVAGRARLSEVADVGGLRKLAVDFPAQATDGVVVGASVALAGVCLTVVEASGDRLRFDCIDETLQRTTIGRWKPGQQVNFERAARIGDEIGGHLLSGHILGTGALVERTEQGDNRALTFEVSPSIGRYLFEKGYIGVDGTSLTIGRALKSAAGVRFSVHLIPETRRVTTLDGLTLGDPVNIEVDAITQAAVDTVQRILAASKDEA